MRAEKQPGTAALRGEDRASFAAIAAICCTALIAVYIVMVLADPAGGLAEESVRAIAERARSFLPVPTGAVAASSILLMVRGVRAPAIGALLVASLILGLGLLVPNTGFPLLLTLAGVPLVLPAVGQTMVPNPLNPWLVAGAAASGVGIAIWLSLPAGYLVVASAAAWWTIDKIGPLSSDRLFKLVRPQGGALAPSAIAGAILNFVAIVWTGSLIREFFTIFGSAEQTAAAQAAQDELPLAVVLVAASGLLIGRRSGWLFGLLAAGPVATSAVVGTATINSLPLFLFVISAPIGMATAAASLLPFPLITRLLAIPILAGLGVLTMLLVPVVGILLGSIYFIGTIGLRIIVAKRPAISPG